MAKKITLLVLAAGESSRLGSPKQLLEVNGRSLIRFQLEKWEITMVEHVCVVLGAFSNEIEKHLAGVDYMNASNWSEGMGASISAGISYLISKNKIGDGVLILLCDQVKLNSTHIDKMIQTASENVDKVISASYNNLLGVPAFFPSKFIDQLLNIDHAMGAGQLIKQLNREGNVVALELPEAAFDIDTKKDYEAFLNS